MRQRNGFTSLEIGIPNRQSERLPESHGECPRFAGSQTDVRKRHRSLLTGTVITKGHPFGRKKFSNEAGFTPLEVRRCFLTGFTLIELLVVIAIIALLMGILMPALQRVKKQSRTVACSTKLKQWAIYFSMYAEDYDGYFMEGWKGRSGPDDNNRWVRAMGAYYKWDSDFTCCPEATKPWFLENGAPTGLRGTFRGSTSAWGYYGPGTAHERIGWLKPMRGSYGINGWCNNPEPELNASGTFETNHWRTPNVKGAGYVPLFLGAQRYNFWPQHTDPPPDFDGQVWEGHENMSRVCLNRHKGYVNSIFLDFSARKIGLKELWTLKWHRKCNTAGPWTQAGLVQPSDWPQWMRNFKDY